MKWERLDCLFSNYDITGYVLSIFALVSIVSSAYYGGNVSKYLAAFWTFAPSVWFFAEFHWARNRKEKIPNLDEIKASQKYAQRIWIALASTLSVLALKV